MTWIVGLAENGGWNVWNDFLKADDQEENPFAKGLLHYLSLWKEKRLSESGPPGGKPFRKIPRLAGLDPLSENS